MAADDDGPRRKVARIDPAEANQRLRDHAIEALRAHVAGLEAELKDARARIAELEEQLEHERLIDRLKQP